MSAWVDWYEDELNGLFGVTEDSPEVLQTASRGLFYLTFATWTAPFLALMFVAQAALDDLLGSLFGTNGVDS